MSKKEKLHQRLFSKPKDFTWDEAVTLMGHHGFVLLPNSGSSHVKFFNPETKSVFSTYRPHPNPTLRMHQIKNFIVLLESIGVKK